MNGKVFVSCAVTGSDDTASKHPDLRKRPAQTTKEGDVFTLSETSWVTFFGCLVKRL